MLRRLYQLMRSSRFLAVLDELVSQALAQGLPSARIALLGFSQGACLALEFAARHARRYGGKAGERAMLRALPLFMQEDLAVSCIRFPDGLDPDDFLKKHGMTELERLVERALRGGTQHANRHRLGSVVLQEAVVERRQLFDHAAHNDLFDVLAGCGFIGVAVDVIDGREEQAAQLVVAVEQPVRNRWRISCSLA